MLSTRLGLVPSEVYPPVSWREFPAAESVSPPCPRALRTGTRLRLRCSVEMPSLPSRTKWAPLSAEPRGWCSGLPAPSVVSLNLPVLLQAAAFTLRSCRDLMPQSAHLKRGERRVASLPAPPFLISTLGPCRVGSSAWLFPTPLATFPRSYSLSSEGVFHFCSQTLSGSNWNKSKTDRQAVWAAVKPGLAHLSAPPSQEVGQRP